MLNRAGQALLGCTETELLGRNWFATCLPQPEGLDTLYPAFQRIMAGELEAFAEYENVVVCRDGRQRLIGWHNSYFRDDAGRIVGTLSCGEDITERKQMEEVLRTSEAKHRLLFESAGDAIFIHDEAGRMLAVNPSACERLGYTHAELMAMMVSQVDSPADAPHAPERIARLMEQGQLTFETVHQRKDGSSVLTEVSARRITWDGQRAMMSICRDRTERQKAAEELRLSEERYRSILNATPDAIAIMDTAGRVVMISPATVAMFGYQRAEELLGKWVTDFIVPEERASAVSNLGLIFRGKSPGLMEYRCLRADGSLFDVEANGEIIRDAAGHHVQMVAIVRDITERKRTQAALRESETNLNRAQAVAHIGSWSLDVAHDILNGSAETRRIFGIAPETPLTYRSFLTCLHPDDQARVDRAWQAALRGAPYDIEHRIVVENQVKWVRERAELEAGADGNIRRALGTVQDITERKQAETALRESEEAALSNNALLHSIMESPQDTVIFALDTSYRYTAFTQAHRRTMRAIWGVEIEAGINMLDAIPNSDAREQARRNFDRALQGHHFIVVEDYGDPALRRTTYENRYGPIHDPAGVVSGLTVFVTDITKRQRAEAALRESDERFRNLLRDVPGVAVQGYRLDGTTTYWNQASETLYGYTAQDAVGRSLLDLVVPPEMQEGVRQAMRQMAETGQPIPASELSLMRKDGSRVAVFSSHVVVQIPGRAAEMFCLDIDLTERKRAEAALRESEDRFRGVVEGAAMAIFVTVGMKFSYLNLAALQLLGATTPEQVLGQPILSRIHPDCHASIQKRAVKVFQGQRGVAPPQAEVYLKLDGTPVPVEATASPITYQGQPAAVVFVQDITERKRLKDSLQELNRSLEQRVAERTAELSLEIAERRQTEERLRASEQRHRDLVETVPDWVWQVDKHAIFTFSGPQSRDLLGYEPEEILGRTPFDFMPPENAQQVRSFSLPAMMRGEPIQALESVLRRKDGRLITVETNGVPIRDAAGKLRGYRGLDHDITEHKRAAETLRRSELKFRTLFEATGDAVMLLDETGFLDCNETTL
ncbi:MAG: PAS domain S-box protein, partial [Verrucomicrobia bacterium]|nr:PAS domain S-box protein [Verrucomicrobiota bacterium]